MSEEKLYSIGQVSRLCQIPVKTLRYYDQVKLLVPIVRKEISNYRYYTKEQLIRAFMIRQLRFRGFKLETVRKIIDSNSVRCNIQGIETRVAELEREIAELQGMWHESKCLLHRLRRGEEILLEIAEHPRKDFFCLENMPNIYLLSSRAIIKSYHNEEVNLERWIEITERAVGRALHIAGPVFITFYTEMFGQFIAKHCDLEFAIQIEPPVHKVDKVKSFGGFLAATTIHYGDYGEIFKSYIALKRWIDEQNYEICGNVTEQFIISPLDTRNDAEHLTKIIVPVKKL